MDFEAMRAGLEQAVPFNQHLGLEVVELGIGRAVVRLPDDAGLRNHVGSQNASALFAAGQAAAGAALAATFVEHLEAVEPLADGAEITYKKIPRATITATAVLPTTPAELLEELERDGEARFAIGVGLTDGAGDVVADMTSRWLVRRES
jgi:acyl-coenzyme A thioesterase PaaI-like protein